MLIAPVIADVAIGTFQSHPLLFVVLAVAAMCAAVLIVPIKAVR